MVVYFFKISARRLAFVMSKKSEVSLSAGIQLIEEKTARLLLEQADIQPAELHIAYASRPPPVTAQNAEPGPFREVKS
jgi:hypothetical protein